MISLFERRFVTTIARFQYIFILLEKSLMVLFFYFSFYSLDRDGVSISFLVLKRDKISKQGGAYFVGNEKVGRPTKRL